MAATFQRAYCPGDRLLYSFGDLTGILREAHIPLRLGIQSGNRLEWERVISRPDLFLDQEWVLDFADGKAASAARKRRYETFSQIPRAHKAPAVVLMRRANSSSCDGR